MMQYVLATGLADVNVGAMVMPLNISIANAKRGTLLIPFADATAYPPDQVIVVFTPQGTPDGHTADELIASTLPRVVKAVPADATQLLILPVGVPPGLYSPKVIFGFNDDPDTVATPALAVIPATPAS